MINQYRLGRRIGSGSYGAVYHCTDTDSDRQYAMKEIKRNKRNDFPQGSLNQRGNTEEEMAILKKLVHTNIVRILEIIDDPNCEYIYLVMDFLSGGSLD